MVRDTVGARRLDRLQPIDFRRWYKSWRLPGQAGGEERVRRAYAGIQMLRILLGFGVSMGLPECQRLLAGLAAMRFEQPKARTKALTSADLERFVEVALARNEVRLALGSACQFEFTLRQADVIGQWVKCKSAQVLSADLVREGWVWRGLSFEMIDADGVLRITSSKTSVETVYRLSEYPIVQRCLDRLGPSERRGPFVVREDGSPFDRWEYSRRWRQRGDRSADRGRLN